LLDADGGKGNQRLRERRVLALGALKDQGRFVQSACGPQVIAEYDRVFRRELAFFVEHAQVGNGELVASSGCVSDRPCAPGHEQTRIFLEYSGQLAYGQLGLRPRRGHAAIEPRQKTNTFFGIAERRAGGPRGASSTHIAERAQPIGGFRVD